MRFTGGLWRGGCTCRRQLNEHCDLTLVSEEFRWRVYILQFRSTPTAAIFILDVQGVLISPLTDLLPVLVTQPNFTVLETDHF